MDDKRGNAKTSRKRRWLARLLIVALLGGVVAIVWAWYESPGRQVRNLMDRLFDEEPSTVKQYTDRIGLTSLHLRRYADDIVPELVRLGRPAVPALIGALDDPRPLVRWVAAKALGYIGDGRAVEPLAAVMGDRKSAEDTEVPILVEQLTTTGVVSAGITQTSWPSAQAAESLGRIGDKRAVAPLLAIVQDEQADPVTRASAIWALGQLRDERAFGPLLAIAKGKTRHRIWAVRALGDMGDNRAVGPLVDMVRAAIENHEKTMEEDSLQDTAIESLCQFDGKEAALCLHEATKAYVPDSRIVYRIALTLARTGDTEVLKDCWDGMDDGVKTMSEPAAIPHIVGLAKSGNIPAALALARAGDARGVDFLCEDLKNEDYNVRVEAARALGATGDKRAIKILQDLEEDPIHDPFQYVKPAAAKAIEEIEKTRPPPPAFPPQDRSESPLTFFWRWCLYEWNAGISHCFGDGAFDVRPPPSSPESPITPSPTGATSTAPNT